MKQHEHDYGGVDAQCGVPICEACGHHKGLARCLCGWAEDGGDGRAQLIEMGEVVDDEPEYHDDDEDPLIDGVGFADPGGRSALRAATPDNPRDQACPNCGRRNVLTRIDRARGYQCDRCADALERGGP